MTYRPYAQAHTRSVLVFNNLQTFTVNLTPFTIKHMPCKTHTSIDLLYYQYFRIRQQKAAPAYGLVHGFMVLDGIGSVDSNVMCLIIKHWLAYSLSV